MWAPAGLSRSVAGTLNAAVREGLRTSDAQERFARLGAEIVDMDIQQFADFEQRQISKWAKVIKQANIRAE
jgi:tripartite-type tricarboxylate transporter receptor subunit TctC